MSVITKPKVTNQNKMTWEPFYKLNENENIQIKNKNHDNDKFFIKDSLPDGNCQFRSISEALKALEQGQGQGHKQLRKSIAEYIKEELLDYEFKDIINNYRIEKTNNEFIGKWDPFKVKNKDQFVRHIKKSGFHFQGDNLTLSLLSRILNVDFIIVGKNSITELSQTHSKIIILYYTGNHYQTIGIKQKGIRKVITLIDRNNIPDILRLLIDKYYFLEKEIHDYYNERALPFTLPSLYKHLQSKVKSFSINKQDISKIINNLIKSSSSARIQTTKPVDAPASVIKNYVKKSIQKSLKKSIQKSPKTLPKKSHIRIRKTTHK